MAKPTEKEESVTGGPRPRRDPPPHSSSHSDLNVTPRPTPRSRHERPQLQTLLPAPPVQDGGRFDNTVGAAGERHGADPAELDAHSERFSPPPLYKTEGGLTTLWASPPAKSLLALVTRCAAPRESPQDQPHCIPHRRAPVRDSQNSLTRRDTGVSDPHRDSPPKADRVAQRPAAAAQKNSNNNTGHTGRW